MKEKGSNIGAFFYRKPIPMQRSLLPELFYIINAGKQKTTLKYSFQKPCHKYNNLYINCLYTSYDLYNFLVFPLK